MPPKQPPEFTDTTQRLGVAHLAAVAFSRACFAEPIIHNMLVQVDVWSVGVIFYQMLFGRKPFGEVISSSPF